MIKLTIDLVDLGYLLAHATGAPVQISSHQLTVSYRGHDIACRNFRINGSAAVQWNGTTVMLAGGLESGGFNLCAELQP